jgi:hypothetical protein
LIAPSSLREARSIVSLRTEWEQLAAGQPPQLGYEWFLSQEGRISESNDYGIVTGGGEPLLGVGSFLLRGGERHVTYRLSEAITAGSGFLPSTGSAGADARRVLEDARPALETLAPTVVCVSASSYLPGLVGPPASLGDQQLLERAVDYLEGVGRRACAGSVAVFHVDVRGQSALAEVLRSRGFEPVLLSADTTLDLTGMATLADYWSSLGPARRRSCRKEARRFAQAGCTVTTHPAEALIGELADIQVEAHARRGWNDPGARAAVLDRFDRTVKFLPGLRVLVARDDDRGVLGFVAVLVSETEAVPIMGAFRPNSVFAYFNTAFYALIEHVLTETPARLIRYGSTTYEAKLARGCSMRPLWTFVLGTPWGAADQRNAMRIRTSLQAEAFKAYDGP